MKKVFIFIFILILGSVSYLLIRDESPKLEADLSQYSDFRLTVAGCPTFFYLLDKIESDQIEVIRTRSTLESLYYLNYGMVDLIISGRALRPEEPGFQFNIIGPGYSFISKEEMVILEKEMGNYYFFTDLPQKEIIKKFPYIREEKLVEVNDVYKYLEEGIIITTLLNTDYSISEVTHVMREDGFRNRLSRTPTIYYRKENNFDYFQEILRENNISKENYHFF